MRRVLDADRRPCLARSSSDHLETVLAGQGVLGILIPGDLYDPVSVVGRANM